MQKIFEALCWAALLIVLAFVMKSNGASDGAALGVIVGVSAAAYSSIIRGSSCAKVCAQ